MLNTQALNSLRKLMTYTNHAKNNGEWEMTQRIFGTKLTDRELTKKRASRGYSYLGIQLAERDRSNITNVACVA